MKKQALAIAIASALAAPSALAAQDTSGMHFTSASEGFYASLRARLDLSNGDNDARIHHNTSRVGVRGTNDLGGGLEGFYQWELQVNLANGESAGSTRLGEVGLRGGFGEFRVGSFWSNDYNWGHGATDVANWYSGWLVYNDRREGRTDNSIQYTTPDLNGFQGAIRGRIGSHNQNGNDLDAWNLAAVYNIQGFTVGGSYNVITDDQDDAVDASCSDLDQGDLTVGQLEALCPGTFAAAVPATQVEDTTSWTIRLGYAQDNWYVNGWYGEDNQSDLSGTADQETFSLAAGVSVDKVNLYGVYDTADNSGGSDGVEDTYSTIGVQYSLGAQSRVWLEYFAQDADSDPSAEDIISIGLRHDF